MGLSRRVGTYSSAQFPQENFRRKWVISYTNILCAEQCAVRLSVPIFIDCEFVTIVVYNCTAGKAGPRRRTQTQGNKRKETTLFAVIRYLKMQTYKIQTQPRRKPGS